ncbi:hypothetical protein ACFLY5_00055 [Patescibacteria group bacterium]
MTRFESFTPEEEQVPTVEKLENMERAQIVEQLPEEVVSDLIECAYEDALGQGEELPNEVRKSVEEQRDMIANEADDLEKPSIMSRLSPRVKKSIVVGATALSIFAGSTMVKPPEAEAKKIFNLKEFGFKALDSFSSNALKRKYMEAKENEKNATTPEEKAHWRAKAEAYRLLAIESGKSIKEWEREEKRKDREKKWEKRREKSQRKAEQRRAESQRKTEERRAEQKKKIEARRAAQKK